jgi:acyl carrier protein
MTSDNIDKQVMELAATFLQADIAELSPESAAGDLPQWDSFAHANLVMEFERRFGLTFDVEDVLEMVTLADIAATLRRMKASSGPVGAGS